MLKKVYVEITDCCNLNCAFCPGTSRQKRFMTPAEFEICCARIRPHCEYIYFHLMGEPLIHPQLREFLDIASAHDLRVVLTTNGTLLPDYADLPEHPALHKVNISLQAFEGNDISAAYLEDYLRNCFDFANALSANGKICVLRLWNENGFDMLNSDITDIIRSCFPSWDRKSRGVKLNDRVWFEPAEMFSWPDINGRDLGPECFCYGLRDQVGILCCGTVVPCCLDHDGDIPLGNIFESELGEILASPRAQAIYNGFSNRKAVEKLCRTCGYARRFR